MSFLSRIALGIFAMAALAPITSNAQPATCPQYTQTGYCYPLSQVNDGIDRSFHRIGGPDTNPPPVQRGPSNPWFGGHFMSPGYATWALDFHTGLTGVYTAGTFHIGMDVMSPQGVNVHAAADGIIDTITTGGWTSGSTDNIGIVIRSWSPTRGWFKTVYGHILQSSCQVCNMVGQQVYKGHILGTVGDWEATADHLHFGIWEGEGSPYVNGTTHGWGRIQLTQSNWPNRHGWVDPVKFIETTCPSGAPQSCFDNADAALALHDMKQGMIAKFDKDLRPHPNDLRWSWQDTYFNYYRCWFKKDYGYMTIWYEAQVGVDKVNKSIRWWSYFNTSGTFSGWYPVTEIP